MKEQVSRQKRQMLKYEDKSTQHKFNPSKAFQTTKENMSLSAVKSPLKDGKLHCYLLVSCLIKQSNRAPRKHFSWISPGLWPLKMDKP